MLHIFLSKGLIKRLGSDWWARDAPGGLEFVGHEEMALTKYLFTAIIGRSFEANRGSSEQIKMKFLPFSCMKSISTHNRYL